MHMDVNCRFMNFQPLTRSHMQHNCLDIKPFACLVLTSYLILSQQQRNCLTLFAYLILDPVAAADSSTAAGFEGIRDQDSHCGHSFVVQHALQLKNNDQYL